MSKKTSFEFDAAGWLFWAIVLVLLLGPCLYGAWKITYSGTSWPIRIGIGSVSAAVGAGFVSWAVNAVLQRRLKKQRLSERKKKRKRT